MPRGRPAIPHVGSVVHYHEPDSGTVREAVVCHLYDPGDPRGRLGLCLGHPHGVDVRLVVPFGAGQFGHWAWPVVHPPQRRAASAPMPDPDQSPVSGDDPDA